MATKNTIRLLAVLLLANLIVAQSNYASHANNVEYAGDGLPEEATLDGKVRIALIVGKAKERRQFLIKYNFR